jgi:hypothetical protein
MSYTPYAPGTVSELLDMLGFIMVKAPSFEDPIFPGRNLHSVFVQLNDGLERVRPKIGDEKFAALTEIAKTMRAYFEADPEDKSGAARKGRALVHEMRAILRGR